MGKKSRKGPAFRLQAPDLGKIRASSSPRLVEVDVLAGGWTLIQKDGLPGFIPDEGVQSAARAFEGKSVYAFKASDSDLFDHLGPSDKKWLAENNEIGTLRDGRVEGSAARYDLKLFPGVPESIGALIRAAAEAADEAPIGLSVDCGTKSRRTMRENEHGVSTLCLDFYEFGNHDSGPASVDIVTHPAAKGAFRRIAASVAKTAQQERAMTDAEKKAAEEKAAADKAKAEALQASEKDAREKIQAAEKRAEEAAKKAEKVAHDMEVSASLMEARQKLSASKLPATWRDKIAADLAKSGEIVKAEAVDAEITLARDLLKAAREDSAITVSATSEDKQRLGLERLVLGMSPPKWVEEAYSRRMGYGKVMLSEREQEAGIGYRDRATSWRKHFAQVHGGDITDLWDRPRRDPSRQRITASIATGTWADNFENVLNVVANAYGEDPDFSDWRRIVSVVPINNIHKQERVITGGYTNLPTVAQGDAYVKAASPGDEGHGYTVSKYGYTEDWTREAMIQDAVRELQKIPQKMGLAYARTRYEFVFDLITFAGNPTMDYDSAILFNETTHSNVTTTALSAAALEASRLKMKQQADISSSKRMGIRPRYLLVPEEKEKTAFDLLKPLGQHPGGSTDDNEWVRQFGLQVITVRHWTNTTDWFLVADQNNGLVPTFEMGFEGGREDATITIQDMANVGSVFDADKVTVKISTPFFGGSPLRHEGFQGNNV